MLFANFAANRVVVILWLPSLHREEKGTLLSVIMVSVVYRRLAGAAAPEAKVNFAALATNVFTAIVFEIGRETLRA